MMKYIIWGAGRRGKWTFRFLEEKNVLAFIDGNSERVGEEFCGKKIISFEEAEETYHDFIIVLTPSEGSNEIAHFLESRSFYRFFKLDDLPMNLPCDERDEYSVDFSYNRQFEYGFIGVDLFSICLYQKMTEAHATVRVALANEVHPDFVQFLQKYISLSSREEIIENSDQVIATGEFFQSDCLEKFVTREDFVMKHMLPIREDLLKFKNIHQGKRCFIVATGPSLKVEDLDKLHANGDICISMNRIFNIFDRTKWRPDYYLIGDTEMIEDLSEEIANLNLKYKFVATEPKSFWEMLPDNDCFAYKLLLRGFVDKAPFFSSCIECGMGHGTTVTYLCIQLAVYMGFSEIYLLGVDCNYTRNLYDASNHFEGCDTNENRIRLNTVYPERMLLAYEKAKEYCDEHEVKIYNATRGGKLEVYKRVQFDHLF